MSKVIQPVLWVTSQFLNLACRPEVVGPAVLALGYGPDLIKEPLTRLAASQNLLSVDAIRRILKYLFAIGLTTSINARLNAWAMNHFRFSPNAGWDWPKEVAVVTGGSSGIGKEISLGLAARGVKVTILDVAEPPSDLAALSNIDFLHCDISSSEALSKAADTIRSRHGHPTILVNNAGIGTYHSILSTPEPQLRAIFNVNIVSHWLTLQTFLPAMIERDHGHVVGIASLASFAAMPMMADYAATKAGMLALYESLNQELRLIHGVNGVLNSIVHPSWTRTPIIEDYRERLEKGRGGILSASFVGNAVVEQILSCKGGQIVLPKQVGVFAGMRGWPNWIQEGLRTKAAKELTADDFTK